MAAMCGRWRIGTSLTEHPIDGNSMPRYFDKSTANTYNYELPGGGPDMGSVCPIGAHMRRANMRLKAGDPPLPQPFPKPVSSRSRVMRRAMPYQYPFNADDRNDPSTERGLAGHFLGASLLQQFEQVFGSWMNTQFFTDGELSDPLIGVPPPDVLTIPGPDGGTIGSGMASCVSTRVAAYLFFPGIDGIRFIAGH